MWTATLPPLRAFEYPAAESGGEFLGIPRQGVEVVGVADDDVRARLACDVKPEVAWGGQRRDTTSLSRAAAPDEDDHPIRALRDSSHGAALPDPGVGIGWRWWVFRSSHADIIAVSAGEGQWAMSCGLCYAMGCER